MFDIDAAIAANAERLRVAPPRSYQAQELNSERGGLLALRRETADKLDLLTGSPRPTPSQTADRERIDRLIEAEIGYRRESIENEIAVLEGSGDHRQARLWRNYILNDLRAVVEKEHGVRNSTEVGVR